MNKNPFPIFSVFGIELEYMIVDINTLEILPIADKLIEKMSGKIQNEFDCGDIAISNELALHVIELKTAEPTSTLTDLPQAFHRQITAINHHLAPFNAKLMPTGAHPWLNPKNGIALWPHGDQKIYHAYHQIFNCAGHGWGNLQSSHLNLPFANDQEFKLLHDAIRLLLPIIPALTASTPILEGKLCGNVDGRLYYYGKNQQKLPLISGELIPEFISTKKEYEDKILQPMYQSIAPFDKEHLLQHEWLNSRAAIARFDRNAIEIRIIDNQESPLIDLAFIEAIVAVLKYLIAIAAEIKAPIINTTELKLMYDAVIEAGSQTQITNNDYLYSLGLSPQQAYTAKEIWQALLNQPSVQLTNHTKEIISQYLQYGNLSERITQTLGESFTQAQLLTVYNSLCQCLEENKMFLPHISQQSSRINSDKTLSPV